jgi:tetratricopeptide (TPR) repeat protein
MSNEPVFRFSVPQVPDGKPVTRDEAEKLLLQRLQEHQADPEDALWQLARFYSVTGRQQLAFPYVEQLLTRTTDPEKKAACYLAMGQLMEQVRDFETAIRCYTQALSLEPVNSQTWYFIQNNLGYCLNHFGRFEEAERYCQAAIQTDSTRYNAYKNLGLSLQGQGFYAPAARCFVAAVQADAADPRALQHLEQLWASHPDIELDVPDIWDQLVACRKAVEAVGLVYGRSQARAMEIQRLRTAIEAEGAAEHSSDAGADKPASIEGALRIAVVQRHPENLEGIRALMAAQTSPNTIEYFGHPSQVFQIAKSQPFDVVISGNVFDSELTENGEVALGTEFAKLLKRASSRTIFFIYSTMPERGEDMDGFIAKRRGTAVCRELHEPLVDLLADAELGTMIRARNWRTLKAKFPFVELFSTDQVPTGTHHRCDQ